MSPNPRRRGRADDNPPGKRVSDEAMADLFAEFDGRLISPGGAAQMMGVSRQYVHKVIEQGRLRCFRSEEEHKRFGFIVSGPSARWAYIPLEDVYRLADELGRPIRRR